LIFFIHYPRKFEGEHLVGGVIQLKVSFVANHFKVKFQRFVMVWVI